MKESRGFKPDEFGEIVQLEVVTENGLPIDETIEAFAHHPNAEVLAAHAIVWEQLQSAKKRLEGLLDSDPIRPEHGALYPEYVEDVDTAIDTIASIYALQSPDLAHDLPITFDQLKKHLTVYEQSKYLSYKHLQMLQPDGIRNIEKEQYMLIPTDLIVSTASGYMNNPPDQYGGTGIPGWKNLYPSRVESCEAIVNGLVNHPKQTLEKALGKGAHGFEVRLQQIDGPDGPMYLVHDGSHRVAIAKAMDIPYVLAKVVKTQKETRVLGSKKDREYWQALIDSNMLRGSFDEITSADGSIEYQLKVDDINTDTIHPWIINRYNAPINTMYKRLYPESTLGTLDLDGYPIPKQISEVIS